ncbi:M1 family metallopeptidase [Fulvivirga lutea]|uniref:M1 family metallopeptidase n=2 Tax=Fulvivirga lutea TaxID=2810512 RepID=A0A974WN31_9BACT|nr:M1 family metallopeptidase [Fulvivirga lutea]
MLPCMYAHAQWQGKFEQMDDLLPTPNSYRSADGSPGPEYWQQKADYTIRVTLDDKNQKIIGEETITYFNNSPTSLNYLWLQLDQNVRAENNINQLTRQATLERGMTTFEAVTELGGFEYEGGYNIKSVTDASGNPMKYLINRTMMKLPLDHPLKSGDSISFNISWEYNIYDRLMIRGRGGYEYFPDDDNYIYTIAQWYPRMCAYDDAVGWQNKQFIENGEFALEFGDFDVQITVPSDHIVAATGLLQNSNAVLSTTQQERLQKALSSYDKAQLIVTEKEANENEKSKATTTKTWHFQAEDVRDFAFASSRKFIWDAQMVDLGDNQVMAMSYYPKEANPLWEDHSTKAIKNTLQLFSEKLFTYPYPVAISVSSADHGMEYPMISFNGGRPSKKGRYSNEEKNTLVDVVIHEIGHNYFPMIVNSDEKLYEWMDEGITTFFELLTKQKYYPKDPHWGDAKSMSFYMAVNEFRERPPMTNPENLTLSSVSSYGQPSAALEVLRNVVMDPDLFDFAIKEYANRWKFKRPKPADFFRTMEDASAVDLDWFWRGWFYSSDAVDISIEDVEWYRLESSEFAKSSNLNKHQLPQLPQQWVIKDTPKSAYKEFENRVDDKAIRNTLAQKHLYEITFINVGGLVSPIVLEITYTDNEKELITIPAEIWRFNEYAVRKAFILDKEIKKLQLDPKQQTGDSFKENNVYPR